MSRKVTPEEVCEWVGGCIEGWFPGYTDILDDGHQRRVVSLGDGTFKVEIWREAEADQFFRVTTTIEEIRNPEAQS